MRSNLTAVGIGTPPSGFTHTGNLQWLYVTHPTGQTPDENAVNAWYAFLIAGAYGSRCEGAGADCIAGYTINSSDGQQHEDDGSARLVIQSTPVTSASRHELVSAIEQRLRREGIRASKISFEQPYGLAPMVEIASRDPQATVSVINSGEVFDRLGLDGFLVRVSDSGGRVAYVEDGAFRSQSGQGWAEPGLRLSNVP